MSAARKLSPQLGASVAAWTEQDPDPATVAEAHRLLLEAESGNEGALAELADAFSGRLTFGTAGLRGPLGPGPRRMNRVVVGQAAAGLASYLLDAGFGDGRVVIGFDARHNSEVFARDTAEIMAGAGFETLITGTPLPTPLVPFAIKHLGCVAGVVVTASHNPAQDNGYKVYLGDGSQIVPPADTAIAARIEQVARHGLYDVPRASSYQVLGDELVEAYLNRLASLVPEAAPREVSWVYTPMHGVGGSIVARANRLLGFTRPRVVARQEYPDPDFPTLPFPNPEEPGAINLAVAEAEQSGADLVIANDPDADRCAVALPIDGHWRMLTGDELGALLGDDALRRGVQGTYACSIVSSSLLSTMAKAHGQPFVYTLTGFKWIGRVANLVFGYEEAIGYCVDPAAVPDKDGMSALVRVLTLAAALKAGGLTLADRLDEIERAYGVHATDQLAVRVADLNLIAEVMARLRGRPPTSLVGQPVTVVDLAAGSPDLPATDGVQIRGESITVVVRPSGTEPKLKCYLQSRVPAEHSQDLAAARGVARRRLQQLKREMSTTLGFS